tara:strand:- start:309 stop:452 length:144 start_codon:yes stop_codon:yes gene_type:complete
VAVVDHPQVVVFKVLFVQTQQDLQDLLATLILDLQALLQTLVTLEQI